MQHIKCAPHNKHSYYQVRVCVFEWSSPYIMSVAEFQKLHAHLAELRKAGKDEEGLKYCTEGCYFMTPFREPYGIK
ncbi:hypothetical protein Tcan_00581, partial [Toxocara canis]